MKTRLTRSGGTTRLRIEGQVAQPEELERARKRLAEATTPVAALVVDLRGVERADLQLVQLLLSAGRTVVEGGHDFEILVEPDGPVELAVRSAALGPYLGLGPEREGAVQ